MARTKSNGTNTSTATIGFEAGTESSPELQIARAMAGFDFVHLRFAPVVLANGPANAGSSNQSGDCLRGAHSETRSTDSQSLGRQCVARNASSKPEAILHGLGRQRDPALRERALIEADLADCMVALPGQLFIATDKFNVALAA